MIRIPSFKKVPLSLALVTVCGIAKQVEAAQRDLGKLYLALGGRKSAQCYKSGEIAALREEICKLMKSHVDSAFEDLNSTNPHMKTYKEEYGMSLSYLIVHDFFSATKENKPIAAITIEVGVFFQLYARFLEDLKKERPKVYPLIRTIVHLLNSVAPRTSPSQVYEMMLEHWEMDEESDVEGIKEVKDAVQKELEDFRKHVVNVKGSYKEHLRTICSLHKRVAWELTEEENWFVTTAVQFFESWPKWDSRKINVLCDDYNDGNTMESFFNILWDEGGPISAEVDCWCQDFGNYNAPRITFGVNNKKNLEAAKEAIRSFALLEALMAGGYRIWNLRK